jgi:leucine dehydrogenase
MTVNTLLETEKFSIFQQLDEMDHEQVVFCHDKELGLKAIIAIHNTVLGPAMGGTRMWNYATDEEAVTDALRLSRGMTYKSAIAGLNIGGGKAVIIGDADQIKNEALMRRFGRFVDSLGGRYWTAEDVNMTTQDMEWIHMETPYVTGIPESMGGSGDPSPVTAYGVFVGMKAAAKKVFGSDTLQGKKVLVQGVGNVGSYLVAHLVENGANVFVADLNQKRVQNIVNKHNVTAVPMDQMFDIDIDIYAPCALGATINDDSLPKLKCSIIAGGANNQLKNEKTHGQMLIDRGILYAPDFLINGGGITNVYYEHTGNYNREKVMQQTERIYDTATAVWALSEKEGITPQEGAMRIALKRINDMGKVKLAY